MKKNYLNEIINFNNKLDNTTPTSNYRIFTLPNENKEKYVYFAIQITKEQNIKLIDENKKNLLKDENKKNLLKDEIKTDTFQNILYNLLYYYYTKSNSIEKITYTETYTFNTQIQKINEKIDDVIIYYTKIPLLVHNYIVNSQDDIDNIIINQNVYKVDRNFNYDQVNNTYYIGDVFFGVHYFVFCGFRARLVLFVFFSTEIKIIFVCSNLSHVIQDIIPRFDLIYEIFMT